MKKYILIISFWLASVSLIAQSQTTTRKFPIDSSSFERLTAQLIKPKEAETKKAPFSTHTYIVLTQINDNNKNSFFNYNEKGNIIEETIVYSNEVNHKYHANYTYNNSNKIEKIETAYSFDTLSGTWNMESKVIFQYDANDQLIKSEWWFWNNTQHTWGNAYGKFLYYYNQNNQIIKKLLMFNTTGTYKADSKYLYSYNASGRLISDKYYFYTNNIWELNKDKQWQINQLNLIEYITYYEYQSGANTLIRAYRTIYLRDSANYLLEIRDFPFNTNTNTLDTIYTMRATYNSFGTIDTMYSWSEGEVRLLRIYSYDYLGNLISKVMLERYFGNYRLVEKKDYTYNYSYPIDDVWFPQQYMFNSNNMELENNKYMQIKMDEFYQCFCTYPPDISTNTENYYYTQMSFVGIKDFSNNELKIYPNPANNYLFFDNVSQGKTYKITVYDIQGREVIKESLLNNQAINLTTLKNGLYIYKVYCNNYVSSGKFIVQH